jgi:hypothetical protein
MAIAQRQVGVTRGYKAKAKAKRAERRDSPELAKFLASLRQGARELREFVSDEIVYATMDTLRLMRYVRYELGFRTRARVAPVVQEIEHFVHDHELMHDVGTLGTEQVRVLAKR